MTTHTELRPLGTDPLPARRRERARQLAERGLTTIEYAIGLLAAATAALILLRVFDDSSFFKALTDWVLSVFQEVLKSR